MRIKLGLSLLALLLVPISLAGFLSATEEKTLQRTFIGADKCKICHKTKKQGEQYKKWSEGPHAKAYEALASEEAKAVAAKRDIKDPQAAPECLKCHVTAYGVDEKHLGPKYSISDGVGCESCHGAGGDYTTRKTMVAITKGEIDPASVGLIKPDEKVCTGCHNEESPTYKKFEFDKMAAKIAHPIPEDRKASYKSEREVEEE